MPHGPRVAIATITQNKRTSATSPNTAFNLTSGISTGPQGGGGSAGNNMTFTSRLYARNKPYRASRTPITRNAQDQRLIAATITATAIATVSNGPPYVSSNAGRTSWSEPGGGSGHPHQCTCSPPGLTMLPHQFHAAADQ